MTPEWAVDYFPADLQPGEQGQIVARFATLEQAEAHIGEIAKSDPEGVEDGLYGISGPEDEVSRGHSG